MRPARPAPARSGRRRRHTRGRPAARGWAGLLQPARRRASSTPVVPPSAFDSAFDPRLEVRHGIARQLFALVGAIALLVVLAYLLLPTGLTPGQRWSMVAACGALAALAAAAMRLRSARTEDLVALVLVGVIAVVGFGAVRLDWGVGDPGLAFFGLLVCLVGAVSGLRWGLVAAALSAAAVIGLALAQQQHWLADSPLPHTADALGLRTAVQLAVIATGLAGGGLIARVVDRNIHAADEREQRFRDLLAIAADGYWEIDARLRLVMLHAQHGRADPAAAAAWLGSVPWELPQAEIDDDTLDQLRAHLEAREPFRDLAARWRSGTQLKHGLVSGEPRFDADGVFLGYWGVVHDVSADVQAQQALAATESRYLDLFMRIPTPLVLHVGGRVLDANPAAAAMFGLNEPDALIGQDLLAAFESGDSRERARRAYETLPALPAGDALPVAEYRLQAGDGRRIHARATGVRVHAPGGSAVLTIFVDDTERRRAEDAVRRSEAMLSHLVATSPDVITLSELQSGRFAMVNQTFQRLTGYSSAQVEGRSAQELGLWRDPRALERFVAAIREDGGVQDLATEFVTRDGEVVQMRVSGARFALDRRDYLVVNARDVTDAQRARLEHEAILQNAAIGIAVTRERRIVLANPWFEQLYGWPPGELIGRSGRVVWASDDDYRHIGEVLGPKLARGEAATLETRVMRADGSTFLARVTGRAIDPANPLTSATLWLVQDVTEQRRAEQMLARARDAAEAANRAKSAFLANTSHELRTPLSGVIGMARLAADPATDAAQREQYLARIVDSAQALAAIIGDILDLSKIEAGKFEPVLAPFDLGQLLRELGQAYAALGQSRGVALRLAVDPALQRTVVGDELSTRKILGNYLNNALKFTEAGETRLEARRLDAQRVRFEVHDTGPGIDPAVQARLFRPFTQADESTTRRFGGTGLGLSICRELALQLGGEVGVISRPGEGSCFWAELPLPEAAAAADAPLPAEAPVDLAGTRLLVADDDVVNRLIAVETLRRWGVEADEVADGEAAVAAVRATAAAGRPYDAVLMDMMMPGMSGQEAARELRREFDEQRLPIICWTAAALTTMRDEALAAGMNDFASKTIDPPALRRTLARWIGQRAGASSAAPSVPSTSSASG